MYTYTSIFDGATLITKKDLCILLNLDVNRPNLMFDDSEIRRAYKRRALRFHPDTQQRFDKPIPRDISTLVLGDMERARDHLLRGEDNIPGKAFNSRNIPQDAKAWIDLTINILNGIKDGTVTASKVVNWTNLLSNNFFIVLLFSTYYNSQLNFRFISPLAKALAPIQPYLKDVDGTAFAVFLRECKMQLEQAEKLDSVFIKERLGEILPVEFTRTENFDQLAVALQDSGKALKELLSDDFINKCQGLIHFWADLVANVPSWKHIIGVYFVSLLFTAGSLPKFVNALKVLSEVIIQNKGIPAFLLAVAPMFVTAALLLPLNMAFHLSTGLMWIALKAAISLLVEGIKLLNAMIRLPFSQDVQTLKQHTFALFAALFNGSVRLSVNVALESMDKVIFILTNQNVFGALLERINELFDSLFALFRPITGPQAASETGLQVAEVRQELPGSQQEIPTRDPGNQQEPPAREPRNNTGFFANQGLPLHNETDTWLDDLLAKLYPSEEETNNADLVVRCA